jgi:arginine utilization protein RocB
MYRGATMDPNNLMNVTRKFKKQRKENAEIISRFTEIDPNNPQAVQSQEPQEVVQKQPKPAQ